MYQFMWYAPGMGKGTADNTSTPVPPVDSEPAEVGPSGMVIPSVYKNVYKIVDKLLNDDKLLKMINY